MPWDTWWMFVLMTFVVSATPGPNMLLVMSTSVRHGWRPAMASMAGCMAALLAMMSVSAAGLGALLQTLPTLFDGIRLAGAAYLAYLGYRLWRAPVADAASPSPSGQGPVGTPQALFRQGALVAASNPKAILFAAAFFPQFIHPDAPAVPQFAVLLATFAVVETGWYFAYALSGRRLAQHLQRPTVMRAFNRLTGGAFVGFALWMADLRR